MKNKSNYVNNSNADRDAAQVSLSGGVWEGKDGSAST